MGITLKVTPRINQGDSSHLKSNKPLKTLPIKVMHLTLSPTNQKLKPAHSSKMRQVLVLGGLIKNDETQGRSQVPILGDIPCLADSFDQTQSIKPLTILWSL